MRLRFGSEVDSHHTNPDYKCLVVDLLGDPRFHFKLDIDWEKRTVRIVKADWMPTDKDGLEVLLKLIDKSPTFWPKIIENVKPATHAHHFV